MFLFFMFLLMHEWKLPPKIKIIEALAAVADERVVNDALLPNEWKCFSVSTPWKTYTIMYDEKNNTISSNDSGSVNQSFLWYPAISFLLKIWKLKYDVDVLAMLENIDWLKLKVQVNKDYESLFRLLLWNLHMKWYNVDYLVAQVDLIYEQLKDLHLKMK